MEHFKLLAEFLDRDELEKELFEALMADNELLAKLINDELFDRTLAEYEEENKNDKI